jgi:hypothetical protein
LPTVYLDFGVRSGYVVLTAFRPTTEEGIL